MGPIVTKFVLASTLWSIGLGGGVTSPHSECDGNTCLDPGTVSYVSVERNTKAHPNFSLRYGLTLSYIDFTKADRDTAESPRHNVRGDSDLILHSTFKPTLTLFERYSFCPHAGMGIDTSGEVYTVLGGGIDVRVYKRLHLEIQGNAIKSKCTWHRTSTIGVRYEF